MRPSLCAALVQSLTDVTMVNPVVQRVPALSLTIGVVVVVVVTMATVVLVRVRVLEVVGGAVSRVETPRVVRVVSSPGTVFFAVEATVGGVDGLGVEGGAVWVGWSVAPLVQSINPIAHVPASLGSLYKWQIIIKFETRCMQKPVPPVHWAHFPLVVVGGVVAPLSVVVNVTPAHVCARGIHTPRAMHPLNRISNH